MILSQTRGILSKHFVYRLMDHPAGRRVLGGAWPPVTGIYYVAPLQRARPRKLAVSLYCDPCVRPAP